MLMQKMFFITASPAVVFKIFSIGSIACFPALCAGNPKGMLESIQMLYLCRDFPVTGFLVQRSSCFSSQFGAVPVGCWTLKILLTPCQGDRPNMYLL